MTTLTAENMNFQTEVRNKTAKPLLWVGLMSIVMLFAGFTSAVIVVHSESSWGSFELPNLFIYSTVIILMSSVVFHFGLILLKKGDTQFSKVAFLITLLLGISFTITQYFSWEQVYSQGFTFSGSNKASSFFYVITGLHLAHVLGGIISLIVVAVKSIKEKYSSKNYLGVEISLTYWHFLGALWVYLFLFLRFIA